MKTHTLIQFRKQIGDWAFARYLKNCNIPIQITLKIMFGPQYQIRQNHRGEM